MDARIEKIRALKYTDDLSDAALDLPFPEGHPSFFFQKVIVSDMLRESVVEIRNAHEIKADTTKDLAAQDDARVTIAKARLNFHYGKLCFIQCIRHFYGECSHDELYQYFMAGSKLGPGDKELVDEVAKAVAIRTGHQKKEARRKKKEEKNAERIKGFIASPPCQVATEYVQALGGIKKFLALKKDLLNDAKYEAYSDPAANSNVVAVAAWMFMADQFVKEHE